MKTPVLFVLGAAVLSGACTTSEPLPIVPLPQQVTRSGGTFELDASASIAVPAGDTEALRIAARWAGPMREQGLPLPVGPVGTITLEVAGTGPAEGYTLSVTSDGITVRGSDHAGLFYGMQTLSQLLPPGVADGRTPVEGSVSVPGVEIEDAPRFGYRGMHLDVARHFPGPEFVKHYLDLLARYKVNRFHWHLTEDQGWRIEIDRYPLLTEVGAFRPETHVGHGRDPFEGDGVPHGGFYTKDEVREIVAYAAERYITVIPEIEMPGHSLAALAAYPELACTEGPFEVAMTWGVFDDIYCPEEETFEFLENVLAEVIELFPGEYVHVGGDEAPKTAWEESDFVQALMEREGLEDEMEVQSWFIQRIERFLNANGKRLIGWDEILEGGIAPNATVMSWRGTEGGIEAAREGHDVVMTPYSHLYFDYYQSQEQEAEPFAIGGFLPLDTVYSYEPVPEELSEEEAHHVLGAQANVWTEYMKTGDHIEYMIFPRMFALSEIVWSPREGRSYDDFLTRLPWHFARLDAMGVRYRPLD